MSAPVSYFQLAIGDVLRVFSGSGTQLAWVVGFNRFGEVKVQKYLARSKRFTKPMRLYRDAPYSVVARNQLRPNLQRAAELLKVKP